MSERPPTPEHPTGSGGVGAVLAAYGPQAGVSERQAVPGDDERARQMEDLIERSSFGTPGAKALRARTPQHVVDEVLRRVSENEARRQAVLDAATELIDAETALDDTPTLMTTRRFHRACVTLRAAVVAYRATQTPTERNPT